MIDGAVVADLGGLADDDAGAVVDEEVLADGGAGVDVDAGETVGVLGHDARDEGHLQQVQLMCQAVDHDGVETGVGEDNFVGVERCRVAHKGGFHVHGQVGLDVMASAFALRVALSVCRYSSPWRSAKVIWRVRLV